MITHGLVQGQICPSIQESQVNRIELIEAIAAQAEIPKTTAAAALTATIDAVTKALKKGGAVSLVGFGSFSVSKRAARVGRNPRTGSPVKIKARKVPKFSPGSKLKDAVNGTKS